MKDNPMFRTDEDWSKKCDKLAQELKAAKAEIKRLEESGAGMKVRAESLAKRDQQLAAEKQRSAKLLSLLKSAYGFVKHGDNVGITEIEIREALADYEADAGGV